MADLPSICGVMLMVRTVSVNPGVLQWAREKAGLTIDQAASASGQSSHVLSTWESGEAAPTYRQLEDLAYKVYKRPLAIFFFPEPPAERRVASEFRTLPDTERERLSADTLFAIRQARAWQLSIPQILPGVTPAEESVAALRKFPEESVSALAARVRDKLGISVQAQQQWRSPELALKQWRNAIERFRVFVFKRSFEQESVSGFSLDDPAHPLIVLHNGTSFTRQVFTLFHELGHISFGVSGITTRDEEYLGSLDSESRAIEIGCNRFAAEVLLPPGEIRFHISDAEDTEAQIATYATQYSVSREVVLRRLVERGQVPAADYEELVSRWGDDYLRSGGRKGGGSYYATQGVYLSRLFVSAAFDQYHRGRMDIGELSDHLQIKAQNLGKFEDYVMSHGVFE